MDFMAVACFDWCGAAADTRVGYGAGSGAGARADSDAGANPCSGANTGNDSVTVDHLRVRMHHLRP